MTWWIATTPGLAIFLTVFAYNLIGEAVRDALQRGGLRSVSARGMGTSRPLGPNSGPAGREQNRRIEIVISGDTIGSLPSWDKTYSLSQQR